LKADIGNGSWKLRFRLLERLIARDLDALHQILLPQLNICYRCRSAVHICRRCYYLHRVTSLWQPANHCNLRHMCMVLWQVIALYQTILIAGSTRCESLKFAPVGVAAVNCYMYLYVCVTDAGREPVIEVVRNV